MTLEDYALMLDRDEITVKELCARLGIEKAKQVVELWWFHR